MKKILFLLLLAVSIVVSGIEIVSGQLSGEYTIGINAPFTEADAVALSLGKKINKGEFRQVRPRAKDGFVDLVANGAKFTPGEERTPGLLAAELIAEKDGQVAFGCGADWWFKCFVNGKSVFSTMEGSGNNTHPVSKENHTFFIPVKKGKNNIVLLVQSGSGGLSGAMGCLKPEVVLGNIASKYDTRNPYITHAAPGTVTLNFFTEKPAVAFVDYRAAGEKAWLRSYDFLGGQVRNDLSKHTIKLTGLKYDTVYEYRVGSVQTDYSEKFDKIRTFRSFTDKPIDFKLFYTSDTQFTLTRLAKYMRSYLRNCKAKEADIFFHGGDICNTYAPGTSEIFMDSFLNVLTAEMKHTPAVAVSRGNHEYRGDGSGEYFHYLGGKENKSYYMFRQGNVCFIVLDSGEDKPRVLKNVYDWRTFDRELMKEQRAWLEKAVKSPDFQTAKFRIVLLHSPMTEKYMGASEKILTGGLFTGENPPHKIHLWVCAHTHRYARTLAPGKKDVRVLHEKAAEYANSPFAQNSLLIVNNGPGGGDGDSSGIMFNFRENEIDVRVMTPDGKVFDHFSVFPDGSLKEHENSLKLLK